MTECINLPTGILAFFIFFIPEMLIVFWVLHMNKKADLEYNAKMKEIKERYGVDV
jgi:cbb3-type cytochrome oxidase subunit 3